MDLKKHKYIQVLSKLETLSPLSTIQRGYSIVKKGDKVITSCKDMKKNDKIELELKDGKIKAEVL